MHRVHWLVLFLVVFSLTGCGQPNEYSATNNGVRVTLRFDADVVSNASIPTLISFRQGNDPFEMSGVSLELLMPGMTMGSNRPMANVLSDGSHATKILFTMDGEWSILVTGKSARGNERFVVNHIIVRP